MNKPTGRTRTGPSRGVAPTPGAVGCRDSVALVATVGSAGYGLLALLWTLGLPGYPYGAADPQSVDSLLGGVGTVPGAVALGTLGVSGVLVGVPLARGHRHPVLLVLSGILALALMTVLPDRRLLMIVAYLPLLAGFGLWSLITGAPMPDLGQSVLTIGHLLITAVLGAIWMVATLRALWPKLAHSRFSRTETAARIGRWAVGIAFAIPLVYSATRWAWALGIPLGISEEFLAEGTESGLWLSGAMLATLGVGGGVLTLGLVQRWGERYPRWIWWRRGHPVPPMLAVIPASVASVLITSAGVAYWRLIFTLPDDYPIEQSWATMGPELLWPFWGISLAIATGAYWVRRRCTDRAADTSST